MLIALGVLAILLLGAAIWGLWQPGVRVSEITVVGDTPLAGKLVVDIAKQAIAGSYLYILPRNSIVFLPEHAMRTAILAAHPEIAAVGITGTSFHSAELTLHTRVAVASWCGLAPTLGVEEYCYLFDANGFVYAPTSEVGAPTGSVGAAASTSDKTLNSFKLYAPLVGTTEEPLRATIAAADQIPSAFDFARQVSTLAAVAAVVIRGDEVDDILASGTRLTYVLGAEQGAFAALTSSENNFNLTDGSLEYLDLRFPGKVYLKKKPESVE